MNLAATASIYAAGLIIVGLVIWIISITSGLDNPVSEVAKLEDAFRKAAKPFEALKYRFATAAKKRNIIAEWSAANPAVVSKIYSDFEKIGDKLSAAKK